jgi:hypothetical protein
MKDALERGKESLSESPAIGMIYSVTAFMLSASKKSKCEALRQDRHSSSESKWKLKWVAGNRGNSSK